MNNPEVLIIEDDQEAINHLKSLLEELGIQSVRAVTTLTEGKRLIRTMEPDLLFLDIVLSDGKGFELLEGLEQQAQFLTVCISGYPNPEFRQKAFDIDSLHFLPKPITKESLQEAMRRFENRTASSKRNDVANALKVFSHLNDERMRYVIPTLQRMHVIRLMELVSIIADGSACTFNLLTMDGEKNSSIVSGMKLARHAEKLEAVPFLIRVSRHSLVNVFRIVEISPRKDSIVLEDGAQLSVGSKYRDTLSELIEGVYQHR